MDNADIKITTAKRNGKATVFTDLFGMPVYAARLANDINPALNATEKDIQVLSLNSVLLNKPYNDLGLLVKNKLIILAEAQATWSVNVLVRMLVYFAFTLHEYIKNHNLYLYGSKKVKLPQPEFYVIYTGKRKNCPQQLSLAEEFFGGNDNIDIKINILTKPQKNSIIGQYIRFCHVFDEQMKTYGQTAKAVEETIRLCQDENVLKEYLTQKAEEVKNIMVTLFSQEEVMDAYGRECHRQGHAKGRREGRKEGEKAGWYKATVSYVRNLMNSKGLTALEAMETLAIAPEKQKELLAMI